VRRVTVQVRAGPRPVRHGVAVLVVSDQTHGDAVVAVGQHVLDRRRPPTDDARDRPL